MSKFRIGGFVRCIDNAGYEEKLTIGKIYEVQDLAPNAVYVITDVMEDFGYNRSRFKALNPNEAAIFKQFETIKE